VETFDCLVRASSATVEAAEVSSGARAALHQIADIGVSSYLDHTQGADEIGLFVNYGFTPSGQHVGGMPSRKTLLGLVVRAAAMAALAGIIMRLFGIASRLADRAT
jgi:hypothetical protein